MPRPPPSHLKSGLTVGRWTLLERRQAHRSRWLCRCACGVEKTVGEAHLAMGKTLSCGCLAIDLRRARATKHGHTSFRSWSPEYVIWTGIVARCTNPRDRGFKNYGGRGIGICPAWRESFAQFVADVGRRPSAAHSIDRIDNGRGYEPGNIRWATRLEQAGNKRNVKLIERNGRRQCAAAWARELGIRFDLVNARLQRGWSPERALTEPVQVKKRNRRAAA